MNALIYQGKVIQIEATPFPVYPAMQWVEADDTVKVGYSYVDGVFSPPAAPTISPTDLVNKINREFNAYLDLHYDQGTREAFISHGVETLMKVINDEMTKEQAAAATASIVSVWSWVKLVWAHYATAKANILAEQPYEWNLSQFDATDPQVSLAALLGA